MMGRYIKATCRLARREKDDLGLKSGIKPLKKKCNMRCIPGEHGRSRRRAEKPYGISLRNKQKVKRIYGMREKQFLRFYKNAVQKSHSSSLDTSALLHSLLERRLDNVVYRLGLAATRAEARQLVTHGAVLVNNMKCDIPSRVLDVNDTVSIKEKAQSQARIIESLKRYLGTQVKYNWLEVRPETFSGHISGIEIMEGEKPLNFDLQSIIEFYSR